MPDTFQNWTLTVDEDRTRFINSTPDSPISEISFDNTYFSDCPEKLWFNLKLRENSNIFDLAHHSSITSDASSASINGIDQTARILLDNKEHLLRVLNCVAQFYTEYYNADIRSWMVDELYQARGHAEDFSTEAHPGANAEQVFNQVLADAFVQVILEHIQSLTDVSTQAEPITIPEEGANQQRLEAIRGQVVVPQEHICPLSSQIMTDPVSPSNHPEHIFERAWLETALGTCAQNPLNREELNVGDLVPRPDVVERIEAFLSNLEQAQHPILNHPSAYRNRRQRSLIEEAQAFVTNNGHEAFQPEAKRRRRSQ